jgi:molybdate transport system substrate-binding protein
MASSIYRIAGLGLASVVLLVNIASSAEIRVVSSGGFSAAYDVLGPQFERATGHKLITSHGPSMGDTKDAIPARLRRGEPIDVLIMVGYALDNLAKEGKVIPGSCVELARSKIGVAVRAGAPKPDVSTVDALRNTLLAARSIAYSDSASGVYIQNEMFKNLGIADQVKGKARMIPADPVGGVVARGEAEIGFQQISELKPIPGITIIGPLASEVQRVTVFSAGIVAGAKEHEAARALIAYLSSPAAASAIIESGMEPIDHGKH